MDTESAGSRYSAPPMTAPHAGGACRAARRRPAHGPLPSADATHGGASPHPRPRASPEHLHPAPPPGAVPGPSRAEGREAGAGGAGCGRLGGAPLAWRVGRKGADAPVSPARPFTHPRANTARVPRHSAAPRAPAPGPGPPPGPVRPDPPPLLRHAAPLTPAPHPPPGPPRPCTPCGAAGASPLTRRCRSSRSTGPMLPRPARLSTRHAPPPAGLTRPCASAARRMRAGPAPTGLACPPMGSLGHRAATLIRLPPPESKPAYHSSRPVSARALPCVTLPRGWHCRRGWGVRHALP
jgi:hypothetical protein